MGFADEKVIEDSMKNDKKKKIIEALEKIIEHKRFDEVKVEDVSTLAGVGKGTIYRYFTSKEQLYFELSKTGLLELSEKIETLYNNRKETIPFVKEFIKIFTSFGNSRHKIVKAIRDIEDRNIAEFADYKQEVMKIRDSIDQRLSGVICKGQEEGLFIQRVKSEKLAQFVIHSVFATYHYSKDQQLTCEELESIILRGMGFNE